MTAIARVETSEAELLDQVVQLARVTGWRVHHCRPARTAQGWRTPIQGDPGLPDLILVRGGRLIAAELKSASGRLGKTQVGWLHALARCRGVETYVWKPDDLERISKILAPRQRDRPP